MFIGHFAVGLAAKRGAPRLSLGTLFLGCQLLDLIWPALVLLGFERVRVDASATAFTPLDFSHYPYSHSLAMTLVWAGLAFALLHFGGRRPVRASLVLAAVVASHWLLDFITHRPDLPLWIGDGPTVGLGLWNSVAATVAIEVGLFALGVWVYASSTTASNRTGRWALAGLVAFLSLVYLATAFGPKPAPDTPEAAIAGPALAMWLLVAWAYWVDRNRSVTAPPAAGA